MIYLVQNLKRKAQTSTISFSSSNYKDLTSIFGRFKTPFVHPKKKKKNCTPLSILTSHSFPSGQCFFFHFSSSTFRCLSSPNSPLVLLLYISSLLTQIFTFLHCICLYLWNSHSLLFFPFPISAFFHSLFTRYPSLHLSPIPSTSLPHPFPPSEFICSLSASPL